MTEEDNVIRLPLGKHKKPSSYEKKLLKMSDEIDAVILKYLADPEVDFKVLVALVAHRLGALLSRIDKKQELWEFCLKVVKEQAKL